MPTAVTGLEFPFREAFFAFYNDPELSTNGTRLGNTTGSRYLIDSDGRSTRSRCDGPLIFAAAGERLQQRARPVCVSYGVSTW